MRPRALLIALCVGTAALLSGCAADTPGRRPVVVVGGDAARGQEAVVRYGCTSCHAIPGVRSLDHDRIAPDLTGFDQRYYIAGQIPNRPQELITWLQNPTAITPGTLMPDMGVTEQDARDIAAYLYEQ